MTSTLAGIIRGRYSVTAHCHACHHSADLDLDAMAARYGGDARVVGAINHQPARIGGRALTCSKCGGAKTSIRISPDLPGMGNPPR